MSLGTFLLLAFAAYLKRSRDGLKIKLTAKGRAAQVGEWATS